MKNTSLTHVSEIPRSSWKGIDDPARNSKVQGGLAWRACAGLLFQAANVIAPFVKGNHLVEIHAK
jgi:hypothetical protein